MNILYQFILEIILTFGISRFDLRQACFFTASVRSRIVQFILDRKRFSKDQQNDYAFGIERLISSERVYIAAYPLHDVSSLFLLLYI